MHIFSPCGLTKFRLYVYKRRGTNNRFRIPRLTEGRMFHGKLHDEEDDELPRYEEEEGEEGAEQPHEGTIEIEEVVIEDDDEVPEAAPTPSPRKPAPAAKAKRPKKAAPKKKAKAKSKQKPKAKKASKKQDGKRQKR